MPSSAKGNGSGLAVYTGLKKNDAKTTEPVKVWRSSPSLRY